MAAPLSWILGFLRGLAGAIVGGVLGYYAFFWMTRHGLYAIVLPGTLVGLGFGALSGRRSLVDGLVSAILAVLLGLYTEWRFQPFILDDSLRFFAAHVHEVRPVTLMLIAVSAVLAFWFGQGGVGGPWGKRAPRSAA